MIKLPTYKDVNICYVISIAFMLLGGIPVIAYFVNVKKFPTLFTSSFFIVVLSSLFFFVGLLLFISSSINLYKLKKLDKIKREETDYEVKIYTEKFKDYIKLKSKILMSFIPLILLISLIGLLVYQIKKSAGIVTIIILIIPILFLAFIFFGTLYELFKNKKHKE